MAEDYTELDEVPSQSISITPGGEREDTHEEKPAPIVDAVEAAKEKRWVLIKAVLGELLCTFLFIYIVCATQANFIRLNTVDNPVVGALSTGFASVALIYSFADVSGAHFNPAVTFATIVTRKTGITKGLMYIAAQLVGSVFSALILLATFPEDFDKGNAAAEVAVMPAADADLGNAFLTELILTFILVYVIFAVAFDTVDDDKVRVVNTPQGKQKVGSGGNLTIYTTTGSTKAGFAPIAIGFTLGFLCFMGGSVSGGAFNPARVFGPGPANEGGGEGRQSCSIQTLGDVLSKAVDVSLIGKLWIHTNGHDCFLVLFYMQFTRTNLFTLVSTNFTRHWLYWIADCLGAGMAGYTQKFFATAKNKKKN